jgi:hypothetical protein
MLSDKDTASLIEEIFDDLMIDDVRVIAGGSFPTNTVIFLSQNKNVQVIASIESYTFDIGTTNGGYTNGGYTKEKFKIALNINTKVVNDNGNVGTYYKAFGELAIPKSNMSDYMGLMPLFKKVLDVNPKNVYSNQLEAMRQHLLSALKS